LASGRHQVVFEHLLDALVHGSGYERTGMYQPQRPTAPPGLVGGWRVRSPPVVQ